MPKASPISASFNAGIYSGLLLGNVTAPRRSSAVQDMKNLIPLKQGPVTRRPGTRYVYEVRQSWNGPVGLMDFEYSTEQAYIIEAGHGYFRFYMDRGVILEDDVQITGITNSAACTVTAANGYANGNEVVITYGAGMWQVENRPFIVSDRTATTFKLKDKYGAYIDSTDYAVFSGLGDVNRVYTLTTPYFQNHLFDSDNLFRLRYVQSADVMYLVHPDIAPYALTRTDHTSWTITKLELVDGPYLATIVDGATLTPSGTSGTITLTASSTMGVNGGDGFKSTDVGRSIRFKNAAGPDINKWTWLIITGWTSTTVVTATVKGINTDTTASPDWRLGTYSDTTGWPASVRFHENRIVVGGSGQSSNRLDFSMTGGFNPTQWFFAPSDPDATVNPDNGIAYPLGSSGVNAIRWIESFEKGLAVGTIAKEWLIRPSSLSEALTPANISGVPARSEGSANIDSIQVGSAVLFIQRARKRLHELGYVFEADSLQTPDMTILSNQITGAGVTGLAFQREPYDCIWQPRADGSLLGFVYEREEEVLAWHRHVIGGSLIASANAWVDQIGVIPSPDGGTDDLWMCVHRTINGVQVRTIEYMTERFQQVQGAIALAESEAFYVDCGLTYSGVPVSIITGLFHLEGEEVRVMADGKQVLPQTVTNGQITLPGGIEASIVHAGFPTDWLLQTFPYEVGSADGTALGKKSRIHRLKVLVQDTLGFRYGASADKMDEFVFRSGHAFNEATPFYTGIIGDNDGSGLVFPASQNRLTSVRLSHDGGFPVTIMAIMPDLEVYDNS